MDKNIRDKLFSGRYFSTVSVVGTYCFVIILCAILALKEKMALEAFLGIFSGFSALAATITKSYFERNDRPKKGENNHEEVHPNT